MFNHNIIRPVFAVKHVNFKYWPSQLKKHDKIVISLSKRHLTSSIVQSSVPGVTSTCLDYGLNLAAIM